MTSSPAISGGSNLYDIFRYQRQQAVQTTGTGTTASQFPASAGNGTTTAAASTTAAATAAQSSAGSLLSTSLASLLMQFQNVGASATRTAYPAPTDTSSQVQTADAGNGNSLTSGSEAQPAAAHHHGHHHHGGGSAQEAGRAGGSGSSSAPAGSLEQLLKSDAGGTSANGTATTSPLSQSAFETATSGALSTSQADQLFAKLDKNGDGTIDQAEAQNALRPHRTWSAKEPSSSTGSQGSSAQAQPSGASTLLAAQLLGQAA